MNLKGVLLFEIIKDFGKFTTSICAVNTMFQGEGYDVVDLGLQFRGFKL